jgi:hypothetical protein
MPASNFGLGVLMTNINHLNHEGGNPRLALSITENIDKLSKKIF